jgi:ADP-ribose pyrophosphatase
MDTTLPTVIAAGKHIRLMRRGNWEYAERSEITGIVAIIAITDDGNLILVEQYRPPVNQNVIELPAGLVGDMPGKEHEELLAAARRELLEETGYDAEQTALLATGPVSAGISTEIISLVRATKLTKIARGGGIDNEQITIHLIPVAKARRRLAEFATDGPLVDLKIYAALNFLG